MVLGWRVVGAVRALSSPGPSTPNCVNGRSVIRVMVRSKGTTGLRRLKFMKHYMSHVDHDVLKDIYTMYGGGEVFYNGHLPLSTRHTKLLLQFGF